MRRNKFKTRRKFERLEDRRMMAADISDSDDVVTVIGTDNRDEIVIQAKPNDPNKVLITIKDLATGEILEEYDNEFNDVDKVIVLAGDGDDIVTNTTNIPSELSGEGGNDTLTGGSNIDILTGGTGNDNMNGNGGDDTYKFSGFTFGTDEIREAATVGTDTLDFEEFEHGAFVNLAKVFDPTASAPHSTMAVHTFGYGQVKQFNSTGLENVIGSAFDDNITGNTRNNKFEGGAGSDTYGFAGTSLGTDEIVEAADSDADTLDFGDLSSGVTVDLNKTGTNYAVNQTNLRLILSYDTAIEKVFGSRYSDVITGNSRDNTLNGKGGNDTIRGGLGVDRLLGGADDDILLSDSLDEAVFGGYGRDRFDNFILYEYVDDRVLNRQRFKDIGLI